jgi:hypothetical protein
MSGAGDWRSSLQIATVKQYCKSVGASKTRLLKATRREELESEKSGVRALFMAADPRIGDCMAEEMNATTEEQRPDPNEKLVKVFDSEQESEALVVKGLLDSAGIENDLKSGSFLQDAFPGLGGMIILVREGDEEKALSLIAESRQAVAAVETVDEDETKS